MVVTEAEVDSNAGLGDVMKVQVQLGSVTPQYVLPVTSPVSHLTQTSFTTHSVQHSVCSHLIIPHLCVDASLL